MKETFMSILFSWSTLLLVSTVSAVIYFFFRTKRRQIKPLFRVFVPLTESMVSYRSSIIAPDISLYLCLVAINRNRYAVDMKLKFFIKETSFDLKYLFLDFYNFPDNYSGVLNGNAFTPRFVHGRLYLDRKFLVAGQYNIFEYSFKSNWDILSEWTKFEDIVVINGNKRQLPMLIPCFDQSQFFFHLSTNIRSFFGKSIIYLAPIIKEDLNSDVCYSNFDTHVITAADFFLAISKSLIEFNKHNIKLTGHGNIILFIDKALNNQKGISEKIIKFVTRVIRYLHIFFARMLKEEGELPSLDVMIVSNNGSAFSMKKKVILFYTQDMEFIDFKSLLLRKIIEGLLDRLHFAIKPEEKFFQAEMNQCQQKMRLCIEFLTNEQNKDTQSILLNYLYKYYLFAIQDNDWIGNQFEKINKKKYNNNFEIFEYMNYKEDDFFGRLLVSKVIGSKLHSHLFSYEINFKAGKLGLKVLSDGDKGEDEIFTDSLFVFEDFEANRKTLEYLPLILNNIKFNSKQEFICFLHFFCNFVEIKPLSIDLLSRVFKINAEFTKSKRVVKLTAESLANFIISSSTMPQFEQIAHKIKETLSLKNFLADKVIVSRLLELLVQPEELSLQNFDNQTKFYLKNKYPFSSYYFLKHSFIHS
jgi:hypothetical protein